MYFNKCICIKQYIFYKIDDSINQTENGGLYKFEVGKEYNYIKETNRWGTYYKVFHSFDNYFSFWELENNKEGVKLTTSDKIFDFLFKIKI